MATRGATTGSVTPWTEPEERDKRMVLVSIYEMSGIRPPAENVERWIVSGWPHVCRGLDERQVLEAFMLCMAGRLTGADGVPVTLDLYGRAFSLQDFARVVDAYRHQLEEAGRKARIAEAERKAEAARERRLKAMQDKAAADYIERLRKAYGDASAFEDWGGVLYRRLEDNGLLSEVVGLRAEIEAAAEKRLTAEYDRFRAMYDRDYKRMMTARQPDVKGETVRRWITLQRELGVTAEVMLKKLKLIQ